MRCGPVYRPAGFKSNRECLIDSGLRQLSKRTAFLGLICAATFGQGVRFEADVTNIHVDVAVTQNGHSVSGLQQSDFSVHDEDSSCDIVSFGERSVPIDLILLLDLSGSMHRDLQELARKADEALRQIGPDDRVAVVSFSYGTKVEQDFTTDRKTLAETIGRVVRKGPRDTLPTRIAAAIQFSALDLARVRGNSQRSSAILIVTDNSSSGDPIGVPDEPVLRDLSDADVILNGIVIHKSHFGSWRLDRPRNNPDLPSYTIENVFHLAKATGGDALLSTDTSLPDLLRRIRSRYSLWYHGPQARFGSFRRIVVEINSDAHMKYPNAILQYREGYYPR
jgi:VWFA-related protein